MAEIPAPQTLDEILALIEDRRRQRRWHAEMVDSLDAEIEALEKRAELAGGAKLPATDISGLTANDTVDTLHDVNVDTRGKSESVRRAVSRSRREHPAQAAFYRANKTVGQIAEELREGRPRVSSWMSEDEPRPIPRRHAIYLRDKYRVPLSAWKNLGK